MSDVVRDYVDRVLRHDDRGHAAGDERPDSATEFIAKIHLRSMPISSPSPIM